MASLVFIILIFAFAAVAFNLDSMFKVRKQRAEKNFGRYPYTRSYNKRMSEEDKTKLLIGDDEYNRMNTRIDTILKKHACQKSLCLNLTCGPDTAAGSNELHTLLPGHEIKMVLCTEEGLDCIDLYHNGARVGRFSLIESMALQKIMETSHLRGAYVAEQNCYRIENSQDIRIIIFYETREEGEMQSLFENAKRRIRDSKVMDICEN